MAWIEIAPDSIVGRARTVRPHKFPWSPFSNLIWVCFVFAPPLIWDDNLHHWFWPTLTSFVVFLALYVRAYIRPKSHLFWHALIIGALGFALTPFNWGGYAYVVYACAFMAFSGRDLRSGLHLIILVSTAYLLELALLQLPWGFIATSMVLNFAVGLSNLSMRRHWQAHAELSLSHDEIRRLAATAERERIGRDLHDLLGHTLSLVALKSELAARLVERDAAAAGREMREVERVARETLAEVRAAVSGLRAPKLMAELAAARLLLETAGIHVDNRIAATNLPEALDAALAMVLRESATNILRHAQATRVVIHLEQDAARVRLCIRDDGRGGIVREGNGLAGMRERLAALRGTLDIDAPAGGGTHLRAELPLQRRAHPSDALIPDGTHPVDTVIPHGAQRLPDTSLVIPDGAQRRAGIQEVLPHAPPDPRLRGDDEGSGFFDGIPDDVLPGAGR